MSIFKQIAFILSVVILSFLVGYAISRAWTEPTVAPPDGNVSAPVNIGTTAQTKQGGLTVGNTSGDFYAPNLIDINDTNYYVNPSGQSVFSGNVGIGTTSPGSYKLNVAGTVGVGDIITMTNASADYRRITNLANPTANSDAATKEYVDAASGSACPTNYGNLCLNGGGLQFTYSGKTLYIDAFPRFAYTLTSGEIQYSLAWAHCERIGARLATLAEWQAACSALGGPSGNGLTTFGGSISRRYEWTATPHSGSATNAMVAGRGSCSDSSNSTVDTQNTTYWFRCVR